MHPRIALLSSYFPTGDEPYRGHGAYQTLRMMRDRAELCAFVPLPAYPDWYKRAPREFRYKKANASYQPPDLTARYFRYTTLPGVGRLLNGRLVLSQVRRAIAEFRPNLILNYWLYPDGWAAVKLGQELNVPVILGGLGSDLRRIGDSYTRRATRWALERAHFVITVSHELREQAIALGAAPERSQTILNGFDETVFRPGDRAAERARLKLGSGEEYVLYVGSLIPSKGLVELAEAFVALAARRPKLHLVCGGEGPYKDALLARAAEAGLSARLHLPGALPSASVRDWMVAADLFCLPSHSEGCPNVVVEALACDRAVVGTRVGGIPELVNAANGVLVEARNAASLEQGLEQALTRAWAPGEVAATYRRSWRVVADETWEVCRKFL